MNLAPKARGAGDDRLHPINQSRLLNQMIAPVASMMTNQPAAPTPASAVTARRGDHTFAACVSAWRSDSPRSVPHYRILLRHAVLRHVTGEVRIGRQQSAVV